MQRFERNSTLPAPADAVIAAIASETYLHYRYDEAGVEHYEIEIREDSPTRFESRVVRHAGTDRVPSFARKFTGDRVTIVQTQFWDRSATPYTGELQLELQGLPGHILTRLSLRDNGDGTSTLQGHGEVEARIPLVGKRIEKMLLDKVGDGFEHSAQKIRDYLTEQG